MAERKLIRDEDSLEMIRLVYSSPTYFDYWNWMGVWNMLNDALKSPSPNIISAMTSIEEALKAAIDADIATVNN